LIGYIKIVLVGKGHEIWNVEYQELKYKLNDLANNITAVAAEL
jgi:hypothetical protein